MALFTSKELRPIMPQLSETEAFFRFAVFGGSARHFADVGPLESDHLPEVIEAMRWFFSGYDFENDHPICWGNIASKISNQLQSQEDSRDVIHSMFLHFTDTGLRAPASKFMESLIAHVINLRQNTIVEALQSLVGESGLGIFFEMNGHKKLSTSSSPYNLYPLLPSRKGKKKQTVELRTEKLSGSLSFFRNIGGIRALPVGSYGLPLTLNFPLIDSVVQPNILLQFTTSSERHKGAVGKLEKIRAQLIEKDKTLHMMVFVVTKEHLSSFQYQGDLEGINQYVTADEHLVEAPTEAHPPLKKQKQK
jgi:hypothetical protein